MYDVNRSVNLRGSARRRIERKSIKGGMGDEGENQIIRLVHSTLTSFGRIITPLARKFTSRLDSTFNGKRESGPPLF